LSLLSFKLNIFQLQELQLLQHDLLNKN
jgi:hypothetical protein